MRITTIQAYFTKFSCSLELEKLQTWLTPFLGRFFSKKNHNYFANKYYGKSLK